MKEAKCKLYIYIYYDSINDKKIYLNVNLNSKKGREYAFAVFESYIKMKS